MLIDRFNSNRRTFFSFLVLMRDYLIQMLQATISNLLLAVKIKRSRLVKEKFTFKQLEVLLLNNFLLDQKKIMQINRFNGCPAEEKDLLMQMQTAEHSLALGSDEKYSASSYP